DHPTFFNDNEEHYVQYKEYLENSSNEIAALNSNQEKEKPPQDSNIRQLIKEECYIERGEAGRRLKKDQEKDKIGSKRDKNGKRGEAGRRLKELQ
nr:hypothetical protein [Tanacetum cinerariifolium]